METPKKKRIRTRSLKMQLAIALIDAEVAATSKDTDEYTIARLRLLQTRLKILSVKEARERASKWKAMQAEITFLKAENARLKAELSSGVRAIDCGENGDDALPSAESLRLKDEALDKQVAEMMEQFRCAETTETPVPAPAARHREFDPKIDLAWRRGTAHEPGDSAPRLAPSDGEQQAVSDLHRDVRFSQRSVAERVAKIEQDAARVQAIRDQTI